MTNEPKENFFKMEFDFSNMLFKKECTLSSHTDKSQSKSRTIQVHKCVVCEKTFFSSLKLIQHLRSVHTAYESIQCRLCPKLCLGRFRLENHVKSIHTNSKKPLACNICGKVFYKTTSWKKHQEVGHDDSKNLCDLCGKFFRGKRGLIDHMKYKHFNTGSFVCEPCKKEFDTENKLLRHLNVSSKHVTISNSFYCEVCGKGFRYSCSFNRHLLTHTEKTMFQCEFCGETFEKKSKLSLHSKSHNLVFPVKKCLLLSVVPPSLKN